MTTDEALELIAQQAQRGADVAVFVANQRQNRQPPSDKQLDELAA